SRSPIKRTFRSSQAFRAFLPRFRRSIGQLLLPTEKLARARLGYAGLTVPERIVTADDVTHGKPNPEPYLKGAEILGLRPQDCLVIEDSSAGAVAGHAAGCKVLATLFSHTVESLTAADWLVQSLDHVSARLVEDSVELEFDPLFQSER